VEIQTMSGPKRDALLSRHSHFFYFFISAN
jgi:hypothetical protein